LLLTKGLTFVLGTVSSFLLNRNWTFQLADRLRLAEVIKFYTSVISSLALNVGATYVFYRLLGLYDLVAVILATLVTFAWSFALSRFWVFVPQSNAKPAQTSAVFQA